MSGDRAVLKQILRQALSGRGAHARVAAVLDDLDWSLAGSRPEASPHSIYQIVNHMIYWHEFALQWLDREKPKTPRHAAESWPGGVAPKSLAQWEETVARFKAGLNEIDSGIEKRDPFSDMGSGKTALEIAQMIASHNSYHVGQIAILRRMLGSWPPPGGGETW